MGAYSDRDIVLGPPASISADVVRTGRIGLAVVGAEIRVLDVVGGGAVAAAGGIVGFPLVTDTRTTSGDGSVSSLTRTTMVTILWLGGHSTAGEAASSSSETETCGIEDDHAAVAGDVDGMDDDAVGTGVGQGDGGREGAAVEPDAEIILYGSRARPDSDWDLLILVDGVVDADREKAIRHRVYEVEWDENEVLCSVICNREDWHSPLYRAMPFHQNVDREGIVL